jgi:tripartite-type tricarboxylate transporter receptor subunit TctC
VSAYFLLEVYDVVSLFGKNIMRLNRYLNSFLAILALGAGVSAPTLAQDSYPSKPLKVVVPFPAGGATDILTRAITEKLAVKLGQSVVIENRPGAGANIGAAYVSKAAPDRPLDAIEVLRTMV